MLAVHARSRLFGPRQSSDARRQEKVEQYKEEEEEGNEFQPLVARELGESTDCLGQRERFEVARELDL